VGFFHLCWIPLGGRTPGIGCRMRCSTILMRKGSPAKMEDIERQGNVTAA
jgi:hypothetical protein